MAGRNPRAGERRRVHQPLKIDRLPEEVHEAIYYLRSVGTTWLEIEYLSGLSYDQNWRTKEGTGFVNWQSLLASTRKLFPRLRLPHSNLHRWYDLRVLQAKRVEQLRDVTSRELAESCAHLMVGRDGDSARRDAVRDRIMEELLRDRSRDR